MDLLFGFLKVGCFTFGGGYAAIPIIREVVLGYNWITDETLTYMIAVSESTPGPIMVNLATYIGYSVGGAAGSVIATLGTVLPAFLIMLLVATVLKKFIENIYVQKVLDGMKASVTGVITSVGLFFILKNIVDLSTYELDFKALLISLVISGVLYIYRKVKGKKLSPILLIVISACLGMVIY